MRKKPSTFKAIVGTLISTVLGVYAIYVNPFEPKDTLHTKEFVDVPIQMEVPDRYAGTLQEPTVNLEVQGTKEMIKKIKEKTPNISVQFKGEESEQTKELEVHDLDNYIYSLGKERVKGNVVEIEPEEVQPKVIIKGQPKEKVKSVEVLDTINGFFKDSEKEILGEVNVVISGEDITKSKEIEGIVEVEDTDGNKMSSKLVDKEKVKVEVLTD